MGAHRGWRVRKMAASWVGFVAQIGTGRERSKSFTGKTAKVDATKWATDQAAKLRLGLAARVEHASTTRSMADDYLTELRDLGRTEGYCADMGRLFDRLVEAVPDLTARGAKAKVEKFLGKMPRAPRTYGKSKEVVTPEGDVAPKSRNNYLVAVRGLCRWAIGQERLSDDPTRSIRKASVPDYLRPQFTIAELRTMAQAIDHPYHLRFVVGFYLGLRSSERAALQWSKLDVEGRVWSVTGKGDKQRLAHVPEEGLALINLHPRVDDYVCTKAQRKAHAAQDIRDLKAFALARGIIPGERSPHSLRHSNAGVMTATGQPSLLLAAHLGHSHTTTTAGYTKLATRYLAAVEGWRRGQIELLTGWTSPWPRATPPTGTY